MNLLGIASPEDEAEAMRRKLLKAGVTEDDLAGAKRQKAAALVDDRSPAEAVTSLLSPGMAAPMTPQQQAEEKYGKGGTMLRMLGTMLTGGLLGGALLPEASKGNKAQYKSDLELYNKQRESQLAQQAAQAERDRHASGLGLVTNGVDDPEDNFNMLELAKVYGLDNLKHVMNGGEVETGAFGDGTQVERMLSMYYDENSPLEHRKIARDFLNKPYNVTTPDGTYTYEGLGLRGFSDDGSFIDPEPSQSTDQNGRAAQFTEASSAGERERETLVDLIGEAAGIYDMEPKFFDTAVAETLPPYISAGLMSETGQQYEAYKASIKSVVGKIYSGAVLNETEIENVQRGYIPQPGDTEATVRLKKRRLEALMSAYNKDPESFDADAYYKGRGYEQSGTQNALEKYGY